MMFSGVIIDIFIVWLSMFGQSVRVAAEKKIRSYYVLEKFTLYQKCPYSLVHYRAGLFESRLTLTQG